MRQTTGIISILFFLSKRKKNLNLVEKRATLDFVLIEEAYLT